MAFVTNAKDNANGFWFPGRTLDASSNKLVCITNSNSLSDSYEYSFNEANSFLAYSFFQPNSFESWRCQLKALFAIGKR